MTRINEMYLTADGGASDDDSDVEKNPEDDGRYRTGNFDLNYGCTWFIRLAGFSWFSEISLTTI